MIHAGLIRLADGEDLADHVVRCLCRMGDGSARHRPRVLALGGYPFMGKTALAAAIAGRWTGGAYVLATETVILPRGRRLTLGLDGSSSAAHDVETLLELVDLIVGGTATEVQVYSWDKGRHVATETTPVLDQHGLLVLDGSVSTTRPVLSRCDLALAFEPDNPDRWLEMAVRRDLADRRWTEAEARVQNRAKATSVDAQLRDLDGRAGWHRITLSVEPAAPWTGVWR